MKKSIIVLTILMLMPLVALAQEDIQEPSNMVPSMGSIGIGIDAAPVINIFSDDNPINFDDNTLFLRYFIANDAAVRLNIGIRNVKTSATFYIDDDNALLNDPLSRKQVQDRRIRYDSRYNVDAGYQMFFGDTRMRGFAGASIGYQYMQIYNEYEYGNVMNYENDAPTQVVNWNTGATANLTERTLKDFNIAPVHLIGVGVFTGAEYYIVPQFCIGLEIGAGYSMTIPGQDYENYETMVGTDHIEMTDVNALGLSQQTIGTTVPYYGRFYLFFHF